MNLGMLLFPGLTQVAAVRERLVTRGRDRFAKRV
jgi:hypothetical protein